MLYGREDWLHTRDYLQGSRILRVDLADLRPRRQVEVFHWHAFEIDGDFPQWYPCTGTAQGRFYIMSRFYDKRYRTRGMKICRILIIGKIALIINLLPYNDLNDLGH
jgi:hypothetical protein